MALPATSPKRALKHRRCIAVGIFAREDGLWEVDAHISDVKTSEARLADTVRPGGHPIHDMLLRIMVDEQFNILEADSETSRMCPTPACATNIAMPMISSWGST